MLETLPQPAKLLVKLHGNGSRISNGPIKY